MDPFAIRMSRHSSHSGSTLTRMCTSASHRSTWQTLREQERADEGSGLRRTRGLGARVWRLRSRRCRGQRQLRRGTRAYLAGSRRVGVVEVTRPNRQHRRRFGKHDTADVEATARAVQTNAATGEPKTADGIVEMMRALRVARHSAVKARTQAANQLRTVLFAAPEKRRTELRGFSKNRL